MGLLEHMAEHIDHHVTLLGGEDALDGLFCEDCGEYLIEWDDPDPTGQLERMARVEGESDRQRDENAALRARLDEALRELERRPSTTRGQ